MSKGGLAVYAVVFTVQIFCAGNLTAAPLESGFSLAPKASASQTEKAAAYREARSRVLAAAAQYEHTPYRYGGADRNGLDCSGLVYLSFRDALGISVPRNAEGLYGWVERIQIEAAQPGDLVFFRTAGNGSISHVGIFTGNGRFIHSASEGPVTGVMYSGLNEQYWARTYAGAGRVLPEADMSVSTGGKDTVAASQRKTGREKSPAKKPAEGSKILIGVAAAPSWNTYFYNGHVLCGAAGQFRLGALVEPFGWQMIFGVELRPEWDQALGVFRLPLTLSWGLSDKLRFFAGPALSFGEAVLAVSGGSRRYTGGTSWFGAAGISAAPFSLRIAGTELSPYGELAWQSYFSDNAVKNFGADLYAALRISTGLRVTWRI